MTHDAVAIVGLASLFPRARTVQAFWANVAGNVDCIEDTPASRWTRDDYFDADPSAPDKTYCHRGGFVPDVDLEPLEFGLPPRSLAHIDSAQLLSLIVARDALVDAGYGPAARDLPAERTGVILGVAGTTMKLILPLAARLQYPAWERALRESGVDEAQAADAVERLKASYISWTEDDFPGFLANVVAGRIASRLDIGGITCAVDAACASSLCAVRMAQAELASRSCDVVIAGGVDTDNSIAAFMSFSKTPALSPSQQVRPFSADADGTLISEGIGMIVLKRLSDARRDGDRVYAQILGVGASTDGRSESIYAPRASGQVRALEAAYSQAGVAPSTVGLIEAHGTGTPVGDATEIQALQTVLGDGDAPPGTIALGSVKSQIGHTKAAAGIASLIKAALALHQQVLPPTLNVSTPHPALQAESSPLYLATQLRPWLRADVDVPRRAGVSAFGFGGANYHAVLQEPDRGDAWRRMLATPRPVLLAAAGERALAARCSQLADALRAGADGERLLAELAEESGTLELPPDAARLGFVAVGGAALSRLLDAAAASFASQPGSRCWQHPLGVWYRASAPVPGGVAALFPGQGSQYVGMGRTLTLNFPELRAAWELFDASFAAAGHARVSGLALAHDEAPGAEDELRRTLFAQGALGALSMGTCTLLRACGLRPAAAIGHSFGELTALWAAGSLNDSAFAELVRARGEALTPPDGHDAGGMMAVHGATAEELATALPEGLAVANRNGASQLVVGGPAESMDRAEEMLTARGLVVRRLPVAAAFHTPSVDYARGPWRRALESVSLDAPAFPVYANASGKPYPAAGGREALDLLAAQPFQAVRFGDAVEQAWADGSRVFVEIGPGSVLTRLVGEILNGREHVAVATGGRHRGDDDLELRQAWTQLRVAGVALKELDPYALRTNSPGAPRPGAMRVRVSAGGGLGAAGASSPAPPAPVAAGPTASAPAPPAHAAAVDPSRPDDGAEPVVAVGNPLAGEVHALRTATAENHHEYVAAQATRAKRLLELAFQQQSQPHAPGENKSVAAILAALRDGEADLLRVHEQYLRDEAEIARRLIDLDSGTTRSAHGVPGARSASRRVPELVADVPRDDPGRTDAIPAAAPIEDAQPPRAAAAISDDPERTSDRLGPASAPADLAGTVLRVVGECTGYPPEFLDLGMDLAADLGVDSIKRVEILATLRQTLDVASPPDAEALRSVRTLADIAALITAVGAAAADGAAPVEPTAETGPPVRAVAPRRGRLRLESLPPAPALDVVFPRGQVALIGADGTELTAALAAALDRLGLVPVVLVTPAVRARLPDDVHRVLLRDLGDDCLEQALARVTGSFGTIAVHVHLHPPTAPPDTHRALLKHVMLRAKHLQAPLAARAPSGRRAFLAACRLDGRLGTGGEQPIEPLAAGLLGLVAALQQEWPGTHCRAVDLGREEEDDPRRGAERILAELTDPDTTQSGVASTPSARARLTYEPQPLSSGDGAPPLGPDDVVVVTGGARGITAGCVIELARRARCRFLLLGRTQLDGEEPEWARDCEDGTQLRAHAAGTLANGGGATPRAVEAAVRAVLARREIRQTLETVGVAGGEARYLAADVASAEGLGDALRSATAGWGPITALVHGAGALADRLVADKTDADFEAVFGPKVDGLRNLLDVLDATALRRLALFASLAGVTGNAGQTDYAMANAVLDRYAHELARRLPQCQVIALDWGPWDGGMVTPAVRERFAARGVAPIALDAGARMLADELTRSPGAPVQVLAGPVPELGGTREASLRVRVRVPERALTTLDDHRVAGRAVVPAAWAGAWLAGVAQRLRPDLRLASIEDFQVLKGIVPDGAPLDLAVEVQESIREPDRSVLEAWLRSPDPVGGAERPRFRARIVLGTEPPVPPSVPPPDPGAALEGAEELYRTGPIVYGRAFATVRRVLALDEQRVVTECVLPDPPTVPPGPTSDPYVGDLADVATHGILIWLARFRRMACLPASTAVITLYRPPPRGVTIFVTLQVDAVDDTATTFGYCAHDRDGLAYMRGEGLRMTLLARGAGDRGDTEDEASPTLG